MAANLLVRRSTAGLLRLVRSQAATFFTDRPRPSDSDQRLKTSNVAVAKKAISRLEKYCKKYNLVKDTRSIDEILDNDKGFQKFLLHIERSTASACLWSYWTSLMGFGEQMIRILFWEHLLKHYSHAKIQMDATLKLKEAFSPRDKVKNGDTKYTNLPVVWFPVLSVTRNGGFRSLPDLNHRSSTFLSGRSLSSSVAIDTNPVGERFKCQHETRGKLCKTLEKRNIMDHKRRLLANKYELRRNLFKAICRDPDLPSDMRDKFRCKLAKLPRNSAFARVRNRCITTGRPRAVLRMFRMSRIVFREKASQGALMGVKKSSW